MNGMSPLAGWENFYVIAGSSAGALIGLQFVVITLIANRARVPGDAAANDAFSSPSIVHFGTVLFLSAALNAPWSGIDAAAVVWGLIGLGGIVYTGVVVRRMQAQTVYRPQSEDWLFHALLPFMAYVVLAVSAFASVSYASESLFVAGAGTMLLLFIGIHNAWDNVTYHVFAARREHEDDAHRR